MFLTNENYYSEEADKEYLSVSQYKDFMGSAAKIGCEAYAIAKLQREWVEEESTTLLVGSYVDSHFEGTLALFKAQHPEIFTKQGTLKAEYKKAEEMINRIERDEYFMKYLDGKKQVIMTGEIGGAKWKIKIDSFIENICIVDLKTAKSLRDLTYTKKEGSVGFIRAWGYDIQGTVYQEIVRQNTGKTLPFYIAGVSKESVPDIEIIQIDDEWLSMTLKEVEKNIGRILELKKGEATPIRCGICDYCKHTKVLNRPIHFIDLEAGGLSFE